MYKETEIVNWTSLKLFSYFDNISNSVLEVGVESGVGQNKETGELNSIPSKIFFSIKDLKNNIQKQPLKIDLKLADIIKINAELNVNEFDKYIFERGISQSSLKKQLLFAIVDYNDLSIKSKRLMISLTDPTNLVKKCTVTLNQSEYRSLKRILLNVETNYSDFTIKLMDHSFTALNSKLLTNLNTKMNSLLHEIKRLNVNNENNLQPEIKENVELEHFIDSGNRQNKKPIIKNEKNEIFLNITFIDRFCNYNLKNLFSIYSSVPYIDENSNTHISQLFRQCQISNDEITYLNTDPNYFNIQYIGLYLVKKSVKKFIETGKLVIEKSPMYSFGNNIPVSSRMNNLFLEILVVYVLVEFLLNNLLPITNKIDNTDHNYKKIQNIYTTYNTMKLLYTPFFMSLDLKDEQTVKNSINIIKDEILNNHVENSFEKIYTEITSSKLVLLDFSNYLDSFLNKFIKMSNSNTHNNINNIYDSFEIPRVSVNNNFDVIKSVIQETSKGN